MRNALVRYCNSVVLGLPVRWREAAIESMLREKQDDATERIKDLIGFVIDETKKEVSE